MEQDTSSQRQAPVSGEGQRGETYLSVLRRYFGFTSFRGIQQDIIESIGAGRDTLGLMPTGGGKSITFQVPALAKEGLCLVISPLIALMKDQVEHLRRRGIKAVAIHTGMTHDEVIVALENCIFGNFKFLYVSPERLSSELFQTKLRHMRVSFITVDEAHCISQWGYDFRPSYLQIQQVRRLLPNAPVLALTATATPEVVDDIQHQLAFREKNVLKMSFARPNLVYSVRHAQGDTENELLALLQEVPGSAIIYTRSRAKSREIAEFLVLMGITATYYHAGLTDKEKSERQHAWQQGTYRVMVATNAFGMGIDKADVRLVAHADVPDSPEAYFQEAGRAGRDGKIAHAVLLCNTRTVGRLRRFVGETYPPEDYVAQVYEDMCCFLQMAIGDGYRVTREFPLGDFCSAFHHSAIRAYHALQLLSHAGYIEWSDAEENQSRVMMCCTREELYSVNMPHLAEQVLRMLFRSTTGIFSEYVYIDEGMIASTLGVSESAVCEQLITLSRMHVIRYIPRKFIPYVTFSQRRVDRSEIVLPKAVYADRKVQMERRVEMMVGYLQSEECRSLYFLRYFGEQGGEPCGRCDNCMAEQKSDLFASNQPAPYETTWSAQQLENVRQHVVTLLRRQGSMMLTDLRMDDVPDRVMAQVLQQMMEEEELCCGEDGLRVWLCKQA